VRILHVTDTYLPVLGGIEILVHDLAAHQRLAGHQVRVLTATGSPVTATSLIRTRPLGQGSLRVEETIVRLPRLLGDVSAVLAQHRPDVVHCHSSIVSPLAWRTARRAVVHGLPVLTTMHSIAPDSPLLQPVLRQFARLMPRSVAWSSVSSTASAVLQPLVAGWVRVLPNGIDRLACRPANAGANRVPVIVSVMRLTRRKRPLDLIAMLEELRTGWSVPRYWSNWPEPTYTPAHLESFGIAALKARCCGLPVIAMNSGVVGKFVRAGMTGSWSPTTTK
jgi:glycosyltransferase involved in cell wall biosynthesis